MNALIPGKKDKVQTIITWKTNEPSTTQITYQQGIDLKRQELKEKTQEDKTLTKGPPERLKSFSRAGMRRIR